MSSWLKGREGNLPRRYLQELVKALNYVEEVLLAYVTLTLGILIVIATAYRKLGIIGFFWLEEFGRFILIFIIFLGISLAVKYERHPSMIALYLKLPTQAGHVIKAIVNFGCFAFFVYVDYYAWLHVIHLHELGLITPTLRVPFYIPYLPIAIFSIGVFVRFLLISIKEFQAFLRKEAVSELS